MNLSEIRDIYAFNFRQKKIAERANHAEAHNNCLKYLFPGARNKSQLLRDSMANFFKKYRPTFAPENFDAARELYFKQNAEGCPVNPHDLEVGDWVAIAYGDSWTVKGKEYAAYWNNSSFGNGDEDFEVGRITEIEEIGNNFYYRLDCRTSAIEYRRVRPATAEEIASAIEKTAQLSAN